MKCVVLLSGGVDSTTCLAMALEKYKKEDVLALTSYYGQKHAKELELSFAAAIAVSVGAEVIYYGAHADDAAGRAYPDCTPEFETAMNTAIYEGSGRSCHLEAPLLSLNKAGVVKEGLRLGAPYELTWSCYEGGDKPCGVCGTCRDRAAAFAANGVADPALK